RPDPCEMVEEGLGIGFALKAGKQSGGTDKRQIAEGAIDRLANLAGVGRWVERQHLIGMLSIEPTRQLLVRRRLHRRKAQGKDRAFIGVGSDDERHRVLSAGFKDDARIIGGYPAVD